MSIPELSDVRKTRAAEQAGAYSFRLANVAGFAVVYVTSHKPGKDGAQPIYTVHSDGRCNCGDFIHRCDAAGIKCKHGEMVKTWLADCDTPQLTTPEVIDLDAPTCHGCGFPRFGETCGLCGSVLIAPETILPVAAPAVAARRERYEADVAAGLWG